MAKACGLLTAYALGIGLPFLVAAIFASAFMRWMTGFRRHMGKIEKVMGVFLVATGILFITGSMNTIAYWILELSPGLGRIG